MSSTFGERIRLARKAKGMTQKSLAETIEVKANSISDWENNKCKPDVDTHELLMGVLDIDSNYLFDSKNKYEYAYTINEAVAKYEKTSGILDLLYEMDESDIDTVVSLIKRLSK
jgi:transcriptional regulator with XRE-family HTH domain